MRLLAINPQFRESDVHTSQRLTLDGVRVRIDTYTNKRDGNWYVDTYDGEDNPLILGLRLTTGLDMWFPYRYLALPPGPLFVSDHEEPTTDPALVTFKDNDATLYYGEVGT